MKAPLLIQIEGRARTVRAFPNRAAYIQHLEREDARAKARGFKVWHAEATRQARRTDVLLIQLNDQTAPTRQEIAEILKGYKEGER